MKVNLDYSLEEIELMLQLWDRCKQHGRIPESIQEAPDLLRWLLNRARRMEHLVEQIENAMVDYRAAIVRDRMKQSDT
jgi:hypothetical protein